tara:strand:- start:12002 stop:12229 length:228 start_codon:yes stop_codon:yes gene_type:complete
MREGQDSLLYGRTFAGIAEAFNIFSQYTEGIDKLDLSNGEINIAVGYEDITEEQNQRLSHLGWKPLDDTWYALEI